MFRETSLAGSSWLILLIALISRSAGLDLDEAQITETALGIMTVLSFAGALYGQVRRKDLSLGLFRK